METMKKNGATIIEISNYSGFGKGYLEKFIVSKKEYLKSKAFMKFMADGMIGRKSSNGTLSDQDFDTAEKMKLNWNQTYEEYRDWKETSEAKKHWESIASDGVLRLFVNEMGNQTAEEKTRLDGLLKQLESDNNFKKIIMTDGKSRFIIDSYESPNSDGKVTETIEVPFSIIDEVPTLVECKDLKTNKDRKNCMNQYVNKHINKNFNMSVADSSKLKGRQRIFVSFKIDKEGYVKSIRTRGPTVELEEEAKRVIKTLPQFVPGKHKGELVTMPFSIPIVFQLADTNISQLAKSHNELVAQRDRILKNSRENNPVVVQLNKQIEASKKDINKTEILQNDSIRANRTKKYKAFLKQIQKDSTNLEKIPFTVVEVAPVHPDCESLSTDEERRSCTTNAINRHVNKSFNTDLGNALGLDGINKVFVSFHITKEGDVGSIKARSSHPKLEEEAKRVIKLLPKFIPGSHDGKSVDVPYSLPIVFKVVGTKKN